MQQQDYEIGAWDRLEGIDDPREAHLLVGHDEPFSFLAQRYAQNKMHHAWLLNGPRGIGKATFAFRFAEYLLRTSPQQEPAQAYQPIDDAIHSQVSKGGHPNILVLRRPWEQKDKKFKSRLTVEEVRRTAGFFGTASGADAWRICIVDPADDMNMSAANALLKILEEPPERTVFFVLAHSPRGLLPTIRSRCQTLSLKPLSDENLKTVLDKNDVLDGMEQSEITNLISLSKGSARRAIVLSRSKAIDNFHQFTKSVSQKGADISEINRLAGALSSVKMADEYQLFFDLIFDHLADLVRSPQIASNIEMQNSISSIWQDTREHIARSAEWNMDKKQVILSLFQKMRTLQA